MLFYFYTNIGENILAEDKMEGSHHQKINFFWRPFLKDIKDDMVLETAFNAGATYIITYNYKDFSGVSEKFNIDIITPKEFLKRIGELK